MINGIRNLIKEKLKIVSLSLKLDGWQKLEKTEEAIDEDHRLVKKIYGTLDKMKPKKYFELPPKLSIIVQEFDILSLITKMDGTIHIARVTLFLNSFFEM